MNVGLALRNTSKGKIKYDKYWAQEGRTKEVLDNIATYSTNVALSINPNILSAITNNNEDEEQKEEKEMKKSKPTTVSVRVKSKEVVDITDSYFFELQSEMELPILEYEEERLKSVQDIFNSKKCEFDNYSWELQQQIKQEYLLLRRKNELDAKRRAGELHKIEEKILTEAKEKEMVQQEQYQNHVKKLSAKVLEAELKQKKAEEEMKKRAQEQTEFRVQLSNCQQEAQNLISKSIEKLNSCDNISHLRISINDRSNQMAQVMRSINDFIEKSTITDLTIDDILNANVLVKEAYEMFQDILNDIESAKTVRSQEKLAAFSFKDNSVLQKGITHTEAVKSYEALKNEDTPSSKSSEMENNESTVQSMEESTDTVDKQKEERKKLLSMFIAPDCIDDHHRITENLKRVEKNLQPLKTDSKNKKCRFELQKLINMPINSLSSNSGSQIKTKINRLLSILSGKVPEVSRHDMSSDSAVYCFCTNLMAKQFVEQSDTQISAQFATAFPIALAIVGICAKNLDVWELVLGHFYTQCPYLVPYYPPRKKSQTDAEYLEILGYHFDDEGKVEEDYKFLNRMSGFMRLYAAVMVSPLPPNTTTPHPHGLSYGWKWISRTLNLEPRPDITATLLYDFLQVAGHSLQKIYGKQFKKMLHILCKEYFQKIKQVTPGGTGGPIERLETFLQKTVRKGSIPPPEGILGPHFWNR